MGWTKIINLTYVARQRENVNRILIVATRDLLLMHIQQEMSYEKNRLENHIAR